MSFDSGPDSQFFVTGGTMDPESASYVLRQADTELLNALRRQELCYVLASRQMGKSSLMASTARRLAAEGVRCAIVDLTIFSEKNGVADDWYYALVDHLADKLEIQFDCGTWWHENRSLPALGRLTTFLDRIVLNECQGQVVIFIDEIDSTIRLPFSDDFFAAIRACFNARAHDAQFRRLNFVLLGVATPAQLIRDPTRTPFNVGRGVELTDFTPAEAAPLAVGLHPEPARAGALLERVLYWTDGHPYLTQALCWYVVRNSTWEIDELVRDVFLSRRAAREEPNLRLVRERLTQGETDLASVLNLYQEVVTGRAVRDEPNSPVHSSLRLSGVVKTDAAGELQVRNRIYKNVFSEEWVASEMPAAPPAAPDLSTAVADAYTTYDVLRKLPEFRPLASSVLARLFESQGRRDDALLTRVQALQEQDTLMSRRLIANLIDFDYGNLLLSFVHQTPVTCAALSLNGTSAFLGSGDSVARLWSIVSGRPLLPPFRHRGPVNSVAISPDGKWLATGSDDHNAYIWNSETGERSIALQHQARVRFVTFSPDSQKLISTSADGTAGIWDCVTAQAACIPLCHKDTVRMATFSPDARVVVTVSNDMTAILWNLLSHESAGTPLLHESSVSVVRFHPTGSAFITGSDDGTARIFSVAAKTVMRTHAYESAVQDIAISPDGESFVCATADGAAMLCKWDSTAPKAILRHHDSVTTVCFTADGTTILTGSADHTMRAWNAADGRAVGLPFRHNGRVTSVCATSDGLKVLTTDQEGPARLWRLQPLPHASSPSITHPAEIKGAAFSADGTMIATCCEDGLARLWTVRGETAAPPLPHSGAISAVAFSRAGNRIAVACEDGSVFLWDVTSGIRVDAPFTHAAAVRALRFSPNDTHLAVASDDQTARIWEIATGSVSPLLQHRGWVRSLVFSSGGNQLLTGGFDRSVRLWSVSTGEQIGSALELTSVVSAVDFRPPDNSLLLTSAGNFIYLWRFKEDEKGELLPTIVLSAQMEDMVEHAEFSPGGDRLLVLTRSWAYYYALQESGLVHISSRLLAGRWIGTIRWREQLDSCELCLLDTGDSLKVEVLSMDPPIAKPVTGDAHELLSEWQWRLGLQVTPDCRLLPAFSTERQAPDPIAGNAAVHILGTRGRRHVNRRSKCLRGF